MKLRFIAALSIIFLVSPGTLLTGHFLSLAQSGPVINTVAGGDFGNGRLASDAPLNHPSFALVDSSGNIYLSDLFYDRVQRIESASGVITTVAGNGMTGYSGDGGQAVNASLNGPQGLALDAAGNLYLADSQNHRIRRVDARTGIITTVAGDGTPPRRPTDTAGDGGPATRANLNAPVGLALDPAGNLYIGDTGNNRIRRVKAVDGIISTIAGNGQDKTDPVCNDCGPATRVAMNPAGLTFDRVGNLYVADYSNHLIRRINMSTGNVSTIAGDGYKVQLDLQNPCTFGSVGNGRYQNGVDELPDRPARLVSLNFPRDVAVDDEGNVYVADSANQRIRHLSPDGQLVTIAGLGVWSLALGVTGGYGGDGNQATGSQLNDPSSVALDLTGNLLIADSGNNRLRQIDHSGVITTIAGGVVTYGDGNPAAGAAINAVQSIAADAAGNIYVGELGTGQVRRVDAFNGMITTVAGNGTVGVHGDGGPATMAEIAVPIGLVVDSRGNLFISELLGHRIRKVEAGTGIITTYAGTGEAGFSGDGGPANLAQLNVPRGLAVDANDNLYVADSCNQRIRRIESQTKVITTVAGNGLVTPPGAIDQCFPPNPCRGSYGGEGVPATQASLWSPLDVAVDHAGNLVIADAANFRVRFVDAATGKINTIAGDGNPGDEGDGGRANRARFRAITAVAFDAAGNILVADFNIATNRIRFIDRSQRNPTISTVVGTGAFGFSGDGGPAASAALRGASDIATMPDGSYVFTDTFNHRVRQVK